MKKQTFSRNTHITTQETTISVMKLSYLKVAFLALTLLHGMAALAQTEYIDGPQSVYFYPGTPDENDYNYYYGGDATGTLSIYGLSASIVYQTAEMATVIVSGFGPFTLGHSNGTDGYKEIQVIVYGV